LDPYNPAIPENMALMFAYQGRFDDAREQLQLAAQRAPDRLTGSLAASRVAALAGDNEQSLDDARQAVALAPLSPIALAALVDANLRLGRPDEAKAALQQMRESSPNNETAIISTLRFYLMTGDYESLERLAADRIAPFIDNPGWSGSELLFEGVSWVATARLALDDAKGARELLEKGVSAPDELDPRPSVAHTLALLARARNLEGNSEAAAEMAASADRILDRAQAEGWQGGIMHYARANVAASTGSSARALEHLRDAIEAGWNGAVSASHDPVMMDIVQLPEFLELMD
jgi:tetratricopeptide (TPR) repeat protein